MQEALDGKLLISILAGVTIAQLEAMVLPSTKVVRAMPNTPCKVRLSYIATARAHTALTTTFSASTRARNPPTQPHALLARTRANADPRGHDRR